VDARAVITGLPGAIERASGAFRFSQGVVMIDRLEARVLGGEAHASGRVGLAGLGLGSYHVEGRMRGARYPIGERSAASFDADLAIDGPSRGEALPVLSGRIGVLGLQYEEQMRLQLDVGAVADRVLGRGQAEVRVFEPGGERVRLQVDVTEEGRLRIRNDLLRGTLHIDGGSLRVAGTNQSPGLIGTARVEQGATITFRNTEFEVQRGLLHFRSPHEIEASLDVEATALRRDWLITLRATGSTRDPQILLTSEPPLSEVDILLVLTVGMTQAEFQLAGATAMLVDVLTQGFDDELERLLPFVGEIRVLSEYSPRQGRAVPQVNISRDLTERLELGASVGVSVTREFSANLRYEITDDLSLDVNYSNDPGVSYGDVGADLRYEREFGR
jgi:translocation and assembly module TamB